MSDFSKSKIVTARKQHCCCECDLPIPKGVQYAKYFAAWEGTADTFKMHIECAELQVAVYDRTAYLEDNAHFEELREWMHGNDLIDRWNGHYEKMKVKYG